MENDKYIILNKCIYKTKVVGMTIEDSGHNKQYLKYSDIVKLVRSNKIVNAKAIKDDSDGTYHVLVTNGYSSIDTIQQPNQEKLHIICRMMESGKCIGYKVKDDNGKIYKLSINKVWELIVQGMIDDLKTSFISNRKVILSTEKCNLANLPEV